MSLDLYKLELYNMVEDPAPLYPSPLYYNGNDALVLSKNDQIIDIIGKVGENPPTDWTDDPTANLIQMPMEVINWTNDKTIM